MLREIHWPLARAHWVARSNTTERSQVVDVLFTLDDVYGRLGYCRDELGQAVGNETHTLNGPLSIGADFPSAVAIGGTLMETFYGALPNGLRQQLSGLVDIIIGRDDLLSRLWLRLLELDPELGLQPFARSDWKHTSLEAKELHGAAAALVFVVVPSADVRPGYLDRNAAIGAEAQLLAGRVFWVGRAEQPPGYVADVLREIDHLTPSRRCGGIAKLPSLH